MTKIKGHFETIVDNLFHGKGVLDYLELQKEIIDLCAAINDDPEDIEWYMEEHGYTLDEFIVGAYWHFTEWHCGQNSRSYKALGALGTVFNPNMSWPDRDNDTYKALEGMAKDEEQGTKTGRWDATKQNASNMAKEKG